SRARLLRPGVRAAGGSRALERRPRLHYLPGEVPRQGQPRALLLGRIRPRGEPLLRPPRAAPPGRISQPARLDHTGGLLTRGGERRLLARRRSPPLPALLRVRLPGTPRLPGPA